MKVLKFLKGVAINGSVLGVTYMGLYQGNKYAMNLSTFMVWLMVIGNTFGALSKSVREKARAKGRSFPAAFSVASDCALVGMFAASGWFFTAAAVVWQMAAERTIFSEEV